MLKLRRLHCTTRSIDYLPLWKLTNYLQGIKLRNNLHHSSSFLVLHLLEYIAQIISPFLWPNQLIFVIFRFSHLIPKALVGIAHFCCLTLPTLLITLMTNVHLGGFNKLLLSTKLLWKGNHSACQKIFRCFDSWLPYNKASMNRKLVNKLGSAQKPCGPPHTHGTHPYTILLNWDRTSLFFRSDRQVHTWQPTLDSY